MTTVKMQCAPDGYVLARAGAEDYSAMYALMRAVFEAMPNPEVFAVGDFEEDWFWQEAALGGFGVTAKRDGELAGMLMVTLPGLREENLGYDIGLTEAELRDSPYRILMCTVSPHNPASLRSVQRQGYTVALTKEKYGGFLRHILIKRMGEG